MKILIISSNLIGDTLLSTGVIKNLSTKYPNARFTIVIGPTAKSIFKNFKLVEKIITIKKKKYNMHWINILFRCFGKKWDIIGFSILEETFVHLTQTIPIFSMEVTEFPNPLENIVFFVGDIYIRGVYLIIFIVALIIMATLHWWLKYTKSGMAIRSVEENPTAAWLMGINGSRVEIVVFAIASGIAGAAGCLISVAYGTVTPFLGSNLLLVSFVVLVLAGIGSVRGAMICGLFVGIIETVTAGIISAQTKEAVLFIILFFVLLVKPEGIFATQAAERD